MIVCIYRRNSHLKFHLQSGYGEQLQDWSLRWCAREQVSELYALDFFKVFKDEDVLYSEGNMFKFSVVIGERKL